ncbi:hypothetical protein GCM10027446_05080 [Angustibacter peucedani]
MGIGARTGPLARRAGRAALHAVGVRRVLPPDPAVEQLHDLRASLHRLDVEIARLRACDPRTPALYHRLLSATLAYDAVLRDACRMLGVEPPQTPPFNPVDRLAAEAGLAAAGLRW